MFLEGGFGLTWWSGAAGGSVPGCVLPPCQETGPSIATAGCGSWGSPSSPWVRPLTSAAPERGPPRPRFRWRRSLAQPSSHPAGIHHLLRRPAVVSLWQKRRSVFITDHLCCSNLQVETSSSYQPFLPPSPAVHGRPSKTLYCPFLWHGSCGSKRKHLVQTQSLHW